MMIVVLSDEETEVDDGHRLAQARVQGGPREFGRSHAFEPLHDRGACVAELSENVIDGAFVVTRFVCLPVLEICGTQHLGARLEVIEPPIPQRLEVQQMPGVFLDRPLVRGGPARQEFGRESADRFSKAIGCAAQALENFIRAVRPEAELEFAIEPALLRRHGN